MVDDFSYDVFLSHSSKDKDIVRPIAEKLRDDGLRVWFDEWEIHPGDSIQSKIEEGLENSRVLVLCMSANAFGSDWAQLESGTFRFRDPLNKELRFIPLRLDDAPIKGAMAQFLYISWLQDGREEAYARLLEACRPPVDPTTARSQAAHFNSAESAGKLDCNMAIWTQEFSPDGKQALSGSSDKTVRLWDVESGRCLRVFEGHTDAVLSVVWSPDGLRSLSGSSDKTVRLWDVESGRCLRVLEGHTDAVLSVVWSPRGCCAFSGDPNGGVRVWDFWEFLAGAQTMQARLCISQPASNEIQYANAKVLLVGESGAGKSGLAERLVYDRFTPSYSTSGAWSTQLQMKDILPEPGLVREVWLWDFGGQADQRLIHQLYVDKAALILLVFNSDQTAVLPGLCEWQQALSRCVPDTARVYLVAGRTDAGFRFDREKVRAFAKQHGYEYFETSAIDGRGCTELRAAIQSGIPWGQLERRTSPATWKLLNNEILRLRDEGGVLFTFKELRETLRRRLPAEAVFTDTDLDAVVGLLDGPGVLKELDFGTYILLRPEWINAYAQAVIRTLRAAPNNLGCLPVQSIAAAKLIFQTRQANGEIVEEKRLGAREEPIVLQAMEQTLMDRKLCLRQGENLVFPSYCGIEKPTGPLPPKYFISYVFSGFLDDIYSTLVVRLAYCGAFKLKELWRDAADFETLAGHHAMGIKMLRDENGRGTLLVHFSRSVAPQEQVIFANYIHDHLCEKATGTQRRRFYVCPHCDTPVKDSEEAMRRVEHDGKDATILCVRCEKHVPLWDTLEECFASNETRRAVAQLLNQENITLDSRRKGKLLALEVGARITSADQKCFEITGTEDEGLDMEVEFTDDDGRGTGKRWYLQLKSGNSHLQRRSDGTEVFKIRKQSWVKNWMRQDRPVLLVIGTFPEEPDRLRGGSQDRFADIRWMEISEYLRRESKGGVLPVKQIVFKGERLDALSVRRWRDRALSQSPVSLAEQAMGHPDVRLRLRAIGLLAAAQSEPEARALLYEYSTADSSEDVRCSAVEKLAKVWPDATTCQDLMRVAENDTSARVRLASYEALSTLWWYETDIRRWLRSRMKSESEEDAQKNLLRIIEKTGGRVSTAWKNRLCGQLVSGMLPKTLPGYPAFRVSQFRLRNIGPFCDTQAVFLQPDVNVILGDNAAGKTTILRCLALAAIGVSAANEVEDNAKSYLRRGADCGYIEVLFEFLPDPGSRPVESGHFAVGLQISAGSLRFTPIPEGKMTLREPGQTEKPSNNAEQLGILRSYESATFGFVSGYGALRTFKKERSDLQAELPKPENEWVLSLFDAKVPLVNPEVFAKMLRGDTSNIEDAPSGGLSAALVDSLRKTLVHLFPDVAAFLCDGDCDLRLFGTDLQFEELSDGYRSLLSLVAHVVRCALRICNWEQDPTQIGGIALIDEMDLHLHPAWQTHVVEDFRKAFSNVQLIASTHSPLVVAPLKQKNVLIVSRTEDGQVVVNNPAFDMQGLGVAGVLTSVFDLSSTIDQPTLDKINRRVLLYAKKEDWSEEEEHEYSELTEELAAMGFNHEFSDPYFERFSAALARYRAACLGKLTPSEKLTLDAYADQLLADIVDGGDE